MKTLAAIVALIGALVVVAAATGTESPEPDPVSREVRELTLQLEQLSEQMADALNRMDVLEKRLGETFRPPNPFSTIERRIEDLEKDVERLKRR